MMPRFDARWKALAMVVVSACGASPARPVDREAAPVTLSPSSDCRPCHAREVEAWGASSHARGIENRVLRAELEITADDSTCVSCHAPDATPASPHAAVACASCHQTLHVERPTVAPSAEARNAMCIGCHEFGFGPNAARGVTWSPNLLQQSTHTEARGAAVRACIDCHMPIVRGEDGAARHDHDVRGLDDPAFLRSALAIDAEARHEGAETLVRVTLRTGDVTHFVPTGDVFRRIVVEATSASSHGLLVLKRWFADLPDGDGFVRTEVDDDRVHVGEPRVIEIRLPRTEGDIVVRTSLHRLDLAQARRHGLSEDDVVRVLDTRPVRAR